MPGIQLRMDNVTGEFSLETGRMVCVAKQKYASVDLCLRTDDGWNLSVASVRLHGSDRLVDAQAVFADAHRLGEEICRRWNAAADDRKDQGQLQSDRLDPLSVKQEG